MRLGRSTFAFVFLCATTWFAWWLGPAHADESLSKGNVIEYFNEVVFGESSGNGNAGKTLEKWLKPIRISTIGSPGRELEKHLFLHAKALNRIDNLSIDLGDGEEANVYVVYSEDFVRATYDNQEVFLRFALGSEQRLEKIRAGISEWNWDCAPLVRIGAGKSSLKSEIDMGVLLIAEALSEKQKKKCLATNLAAVLGMSGSSERPHSVLSANQDIERIFELDFVVLTLLYDADLKPGMTRDAVNQVLNAKLQ